MANDGRAWSKNEETRTGEGTQGVSYGAGIMCGSLTTKSDSVWFVCSDDQQHRHGELKSQRHTLPRVRREDLVDDSMTRGGGSKNKLTK